MGDFQPGPFGKYRLLELLGHGGMGMVYKAEQPELGRVVALKMLIGPGDAAPRSVARFLAEARAAARLRHPAIVPIHDIGEVDGRHYFTMDWVDGSDLDCMLEDGPLPPRRAVEVVRDAARAVQHAHENGIVHRDLKPGNILLDRDGRVLLTDFGLARDLSVDRARLSVTGEVMGTPGYMPPEQSRGEPVGPRGDVYALGAVLYHALTGGAPFQGGSMIDILLASLTFDPTPPRVRNPDVHVDLETICLKALEREPGRRYASAGDLADDCDRFLRGEPIRARPPGFVERGWRRITRSRQAVAIGVAALLLVVGLLAVLVPALRRQAAELAAREALAPLRDAIRDARPFYYIPGGDLQRKLAEVERALVALEKLASDPGWARRPELWSTLGAGWAFVGDQDRAETALRRALALDPEDASAGYHLGRLCLERSVVLFLGGGSGSGAERPARARAAGLEGRDLFARVRARQEGIEELDRWVADASLALLEGKADEADAVARRGLERFGDAVGTEEFWNVLALARSGSQRIEAYDRALARRPHYAWARFMRGLERRKSGDLAGALADYDEALRINPRLEEAFTNRGNVHADLGHLEAARADYDEALKLDPGSAVTWNCRAVLRMKTRDLAGARADLDESLRLDPGVPRTWVNRGLLHHDQGRLEEAFADYEQALARDPQCVTALDSRGLIRLERKDLAGALQDFSAAIASDPGLALARYHRGVLRVRQGEAEAALADLDEALRLDPSHADAHNWRGIVLVDHLGRPDEALAEFAEAIRLDPGLAEARLHRGVAFAAKGELEAALKEYDAALALRPALALARVNRGHALRRLGRADEALRDYEEALRIEPRCAEAMTGAGNVRADCGDRGGAEADYTKAIEADPALADAWYNRANVRRALGKLAEARADQDEAIRLNPRFVEAWVNRALVRRDQGDAPGAIADLDRAITLAPRHLNARINRAVAHLEAGRLDLALADLDVALEVDPGSATAAYNRGNLHLSRGEIAKAIADYDRAVAARPRFLAEAHLARGNARGANGDPAGQAEDYQTALRVAPEGWPYAAQVAAALENLRGRK